MKHKTLLHASEPPPFPWPVDVGVSLREVARAHFLAVLAHHRGNKTAAARALGIDVKTVYCKLRYYECSHPSDTAVRLFKAPYIPGLEPSRVGTVSSGT